MTSVFEHIITTRKRANSKKWEISHRELSTDLIQMEETQKRRLTVYEWVGADSVEQVEEINKAIGLIVVTPLGVKLPIAKLNTKQILADAATAHICSVTGRRMVVVHPHA